MDVIERLSVVLGSNVSGPDAQHLFYNHVKKHLTCWSNAAGSSDEGRCGG